MRKAELYLQSKTLQIGFCENLFEADFLILALEIMFQSEVKKTSFNNKDNFGTRDHCVGFWNYLSGASL